MIYFKTTWRHDSDNDPVLIYCELNDARWELRKVEVYRDGRMGFANEKEEYLGTMLALRQDPPIEEIAAQPDFEPSVISADEFDAVWSKALKRAQTQTG
jgi:hypothetical protein